jgi:hypothetical protein
MLFQTPSSHLKFRTRRNIPTSHFSSANWRETHMSATISDCFVASHWFMISISITDPDTDEMKSYKIAELLAATNRRTE